MSEELKKPTTTSTPTNFNPHRELAEHANAGAVTIEEARAIAQVQAAIISAKKFPRNEMIAFQKIKEICGRYAFAESATYSFQRGFDERGRPNLVKGLSIRAAEEFARIWGNIQFGMKELSRKGGTSEMLAYAYDLETNTLSDSVFTVEHVRDTKQGRKTLTDSRDIYELNANLSSRRLRARILSLIPMYILEAAEEIIAKTVAAGAGDVPLSDRIANMLGAFAKLGVKAEHLEKYFEKDIKDFFPEDLAQCIAIFNSIKEGATTPADWFDVKRGAINTANDSLGRIAASVDGNAKPKVDENQPE